MALRCATCGHLRPLHEHYRPGTDCAMCGCPRWLHPLAGWVRHLMRGRPWT